MQFIDLATGKMIALLGARPVFVDIDAGTYNLDPALIEAAITPRTRAIVPVSLYGQCADMDAINAIGERHRIPVIEDGATYGGRRSCGLSTLAATSFFPAKPLGCYGDGGAAFTTDAALDRCMRELRNHGQDRRYHHPRIGINGRMDTLQAAVLLAKRPIFDDEIAARQRIAARYDSQLADVVRTPRLAPGNTSVYAQYTIEEEARDTVAERLREAGVPSAVYYPVPLNRQPALATDEAVPVADGAAERVLSLPMHPYLHDSEQAAIIAAVREAVA